MEYVTYKTTKPLEKISRGFEEILDTIINLLFL
jgi:hypothetical protein